MPEQLTTGQIIVLFACIFIPVYIILVCFISTLDGWAESFKTVTLVYIFTALAVAAIYGLVHLCATLPI